MKHLSLAFTLLLAGCPLTEIPVCESRNPPPDCSADVDTSTPEDVGGTDATNGTDAGSDGAQTDVPDAEPDMVQRPCASGCTDPKPVCDELTDTCVECLTTADCGVGVCDETTHACVECVTAADCDDGVCDEVANACVECLTTNDCAAGVCDEPANACVECVTAADCAAGVCDPMANVCVQCLLDADCNNGVCDPATASCVGCLTDADCNAGVCDQATDTCVECLTSADCNGGVCDPTANLCVQCLADTDCPNQVCDQNTCVDCARDADCPDAAASQCQNNVCVGCTDSTHCAHLPGTGVCDAGTCVECTGLDDSACGGNVCDSRLQTCTTFAPATLGLCQSCVSDAQCFDGMLCVPMTFAAADGTGPAEVGTYCLWERDATGINAPNGSCFAVRPYVSAKSATSLDGTQTTVCGLATTTCPGLDDFRRDCTAPGIDDDCGAPGFDDGLCVAVDVVTNKCTVVCGGDDDCRDGFTCDTNFTPRRCTL